MNDFLYFDPEDIYQLDEKNNTVFCNLYSCLRKWNDHIVKNSLQSKTPKIKNCFDAISHWCNEDMLSKINEETKIVTHAGDWGIKCSKPHPNHRAYCQYSLSSADRHGKFLPLDINSIASNFSAWFSTNLDTDIHRKMYPIPVSVNKGDWKNIDLEELRKIPKEDLCYANFCITSNPRILIAEWVDQQMYINSYLPKRKPDSGEDTNLKLPMLQDHRLAMSEYLEALASHSFCIAPIGNGFDTYRTWECILLNTVPIVQDTFCNRVFSKIWPMIVVDKYQHTDILRKMSEFTDEHGTDINYNYELLLKENFEELLERIVYESDRLRR